MPPLVSPTQVFTNYQIARFLAVMVMAQPEYLEACQVLRVLFNCMDGDKYRAFLLSDMKNMLKTLLYQRPDYCEPVKVFRGYVGVCSRNGKNRTLSF